MSLWVIPVFCPISFSIVFNSLLLDAVMVNHMLYSCSRS